MQHSLAQTLSYSIDNTYLCTQEIGMNKRKYTSKYEKDSIHLMSFLVLCNACSSDTNIVDSPVKDGSYIYKSGSTAVSIVIRNEKCYGVTIFSDNTACFQAGNGFMGGGRFETSGTYPNFTYSYSPDYNKDEPWSLSVIFSGSTFQANPLGKLYKWHNSNETIDLPNTMTFNKSDAFSSLKPR